MRRAECRLKAKCYPGEEVGESLHSVVMCSVMDEIVFT